MTRRRLEVFRWSPGAPERRQGYEVAAWPDTTVLDALVEVQRDEDPTLGFRYAWDPRSEQYAHPAVVFVLTPDGRIAEYVRGVTFDGLAPALERAARGTLTSATARDLLACFHFDPSLRRYEAKIALLFRLGAAVVLAVLVGLIAALVAWERRRRT